jgi:hypothetical protein
MAATGGGISVRPAVAVSGWLAGSLALALAACAAPPPSLGRPFVAEEATSAPAAPGAAYARGREDQRRGVGLPPILPPPVSVDRLPGALRASRPAPGTGPAGPPPLPAPSGSLSRLSALPAAPLANPPGGLGAARPW